MKKTLHLLLVSLLSGGIAAQAEEKADSPTEGFTFKFNPPDGVKVRQTFLLKRSRVVDGQPQSNDESESKLEGVFKKTGEGFEYSPATISATLRRNGVEINDPIVGLLSAIRPTYVLGKSGEAIAVRGFGDIEATIKSSLPPQLAAALAPVLNEAVLVNREKAEWNARYSDFADGVFKIGDALDIQAPQQLPTGETITYTIRTQFPRWEPCPAGRCIRIEQIYESDATALANMAAGIVNSIVPAKADTKYSGARISGSLSRLIDPNTMLIYSEQVQRTISMELQMAGKGRVPTVQDEIRTYSYAYD